MKLNEHQVSKLRRALLCSICVPLGFGLCTEAIAQDWPVKPIKIIVPYSAGGSLDNTARLLAQKLGERLMQPVVVENITGAGGGIGFHSARQAAPDGYTFLMAGDAPLQPNPRPGGSQYALDVLNELQPVILVNTAPMVLVANPSLPAKNLADLVALAKSRPGKLSYATAGLGTLPHLAAEMTKRAGAFDMVHIPYRGGSQIANDVAGNQVDLAMMVAATARPFIQTKALKPIAVTGNRRLALFPDTAAATETPGFESVNLVSWAGLYAPRKTSVSIITRLNREVDAILQSTSVRESFAGAGMLPGGGVPSAFVSFIQQDREKIGKILEVTSLRE
jgi:tripartite-type tricarboxylate transporter receptor subunit TctC